MIIKNSINNRFYLTLVINISLIISAYGQNHIYKGDNKYLATTTWVFRLNADYWTSDPEITIARAPDGGYLMIAIEVPFKQNYIGGPITVFLVDGTTIKCIDKGMRDYVDKKSIALYNFTDKEMEKLMFSRITKVRFSILGGPQGQETFTADNKKDAFLTLDPEDKNYYATDAEVFMLFSNDD